MIIVLWYARSRARDQVMLLLLLTMVMISSLTLSHIVVIVCLFCSFLVLLLLRIFFLHTLTLPIVLHILPWCYFTCAQWLLSYQSECCLFLPSLLASWSSRCSIMYQQHIDWKRLSHTLCIYALKFLVKRGMRWVMKREGNRDNSMGTNFNRLQFKCYHCVYEAVRVFLSLSFFSLCVC